MTMNNKVREEIANRMKGGLGVKILFLLNQIEIESEIYGDIININNEWVVKYNFYSGINRLEERIHLFNLNLQILQNKGFITYLDDQDYYMVNPMLFSHIYQTEEDYMEAVLRWSKWAHVM